MKRNLSISAAILGVMWLAATGVLLFFVAGLAGVPALLIAFVTMDAAFLTLLAIYLVTNTRVPLARPADPYAATTDELMREAVILPDGRPYGRRARDDRTVVKRSLTEQISDLVEEEAARRPHAAKTPAWAISLQSAHEDAAAMFPDAPPDDLEGM